MKITCCSRAKLFISLCPRCYFSMSNSFSVVFEQSVLFALRYWRKWLFTCTNSKWFSMNNSQKQTPCTQSKVFFISLSVTPRDSSFHRRRKSRIWLFSNLCGWKCSLKLKYWSFTLQSPCITLETVWAGRWISHLSPYLFVYMFPSMHSLQR